MVNKKFKQLIDECYGSTDEESIRKVAKKIWEAGGQQKGFDYENWKAAEWVHGHFDTLTDEIVRTTSRYIEAEQALVELRESWVFRIAAVFYPRFNRIVLDVLNRALSEDEENCI